MDDIFLRPVIGFRSPFFVRILIRVPFWEEPFREESFREEPFWEEFPPEESKEREQLALQPKNASDR